MVKLTINLRSKYTFFTISGLILLFLLFYITRMMWSIDLTGLDRLIYFLLIILTTFMFWVPYQFNEQFT